MSILAWLVLGAVAGFIASKIVDNTGQGLLIDIVLGIVGAFVGGYVFSLLGAAPITGAVPFDGQARRAPSRLPGRPDRGSEAAAHAVGGSCRRWVVPPVGRAAGGSCRR